MQANRKAGACACEHVMIATPARRTNNDQGKQRNENRFKTKEPKRRIKTQAKRWVLRTHARAAGGRDTCTIAGATTADVLSAYNADGDDRDN